MRGIVQQGFGDPIDVLRLAEVDAPEPSEDEVLVRVSAASIHIGAVYGARGYPRVMRPMFRSLLPSSGVAGTNFSGTVAAIGARVTGLAPGDRVFGSCKGAFAELAVAAPDAVTLVPDGVTLEQASAIGVSALTALQGLRTHGRLREGQHVLITGASGGVGTFAVQIAKALGAEVTAVCSTRNAELVASIGADHVVDYTREDFTAGGPRFDLIFDNIGAFSLRRTRSALAPGGLLLSNGAPAPSGWFGGLGHPFRVGLASLVSKRQARPFLQTENAEDLAMLRELATEGAVTPVIDRSFPLEQGVEAVSYVGEGHNRGTSIIVM